MLAGTPVHSIMQDYCNLKAVSLIYFAAQVIKILLTMECLNHISNIPVLLLV
jgi:hypothetical protein